MKPSSSQNALETMKNIAGAQYMRIRFVQIVNLKIKLNWEKKHLLHTTVIENYSIVTISFEINRYLALFSPKSF